MSNGLSAAVLWTANQRDLALMHANACLAAGKSHAAASADLEVPPALMLAMEATMYVHCQQQCWPEMHDGLRLLKAACAVVPFSNYLFEPYAAVLQRQQAPQHPSSPARSASTSPSSAEQLSVTSHSSHTSLLLGTPPLLELSLLQELSPLQAGLDLLPLASPLLPRIDPSPALAQLRSSSSGFSAEMLLPASPLIESALQMQPEDYFTSIDSSPLSPVSFL